MANEDNGWSRASNNIQAKVVFENEWFSIVNRDSYYSLEYSVPQVVILPIVNNEVVMVKVNRPLINDTPWELPAGGGHKNEHPKITARRELEEETGIKINKISRFTDMLLFSELPGRSAELLIAYKVEITPEEYNSRGPFDSSEIMEIRKFSIQQLKMSIVKGKFYVCSPVALISKYIFENELK